jgi:hypothetical protein
MISFMLLVALLIDKGFRQDLLEENEEGKILIVEKFAVIIMFDTITFVLGGCFNFHFVCTYLGAN